MKLLIEGGDARYGYNNGDLVQEGEAAKEKIIEQAINLGEPLPIVMWGLGWLMAIASMFNSVV